MFSQASPLIQELYAATRETKEQPTLARLVQAKSLIDSGADMKGTDSLGRTALHWAIFGSSYASSAALIVAYEDVAAALIAHGVAGSATGYADVNRPAAPRTTANATGDDIVTDGVMSVVQVGPAKAPAPGPPQLISR